VTAPSGTGFAGMEMRLIGCWFAGGKRALIAARLGRSMQAIEATVARMEHRGSDAQSRTDIPGLRGASSRLRTT
jgi:hypothetical protein